MTLVSPAGTTPSHGPGPSARRPSRWWVAGIPVAVALMLTASAYRVQVFWFEEGQHRELASADAGEWATASETYTDVHGETTRNWSVRFAGLGGASPAVVDSFGNEVSLTDGMVARTVDLQFRAEPDQQLSYCTLTLVDDEGRTYAAGGAGSALGDPAHGCVPEETPGPSLPVLQTDPRGVPPADTPPRPREWSTSPAIAVPEDARLVELRVSFLDPGYVSLRLAR